MKVSLNWVKEYLDFELPPVDELVAKIGAQLGAVEEVVDLGARYKGIVIVKVASCQKLEGSDHLSVCRIDDGGNTPGVNRGEDGLVQVVCGAPNVREGMLVAWLPPGTTVPSTFDNDPFVLEAREIRGQTSNGMLASAKELAIGDSHEGLLDLTPRTFAASSQRKPGSSENDAAAGGAASIWIPGQARNDSAVKPGDDFAKVYKLDDVIIDIENKMFTHRPDCFGMLGVAREIAGICGQPFTSPEVYKARKTAGNTTSELLEIRNEIPELVPRFVAQVFQSVTIQPSPVWMQTYLSRVGVRPINNVVDITNYFMLLTGQPLHAYDYDKLKALDGSDKATIVVRNPRASEKLTLLNGKTIDPRQEAILIASATKPIGLGGVMGGAETEVDEHTQNIVLECATFDMYSIRRTSMAHGIFSDAVTRFNKGQSPLQNDRIAAWVASELVHVAHATPADVIDLNYLPVEVKDRDSLYPPVRVAESYINERLGLNLSGQEMATLLQNVEFEVGETEGHLTVKPPFWRTDIELREDIVEEVGRLHGFDRLPLELPVRQITPPVKDALLELKSQVRAALARAGANEVLTYSFVHGQLLQKAGQDPQQAFRVSNALSPELQYYRLSLTPSLLEKVHPNSKAGYDRFALFEIGKGHNRSQIDEQGLPVEFEMLDVVFAAAGKADTRGAAFYQARKFLAELADGFGVQLEFRPFEEEEQYQVVKPYDHQRSAKLFVRGSGIPLGTIGEYKASVARNFKLPKHCAGFSVGLTQLLQAIQQAANPYVPLPKYPKVTQDISLRVPAALPYAELEGYMVGELVKAKPANTYLGTATLDIYQRQEDPAHKQVTFRISIASYEKTLTDTEVNAMLDTVAAAAHGKFGAERI